MAPTVTTGRFVGTCKVVATLTTGRFVDNFTVATTADNGSIPVVFALTTPSLEKHSPITETSTELVLVREPGWPSFTQEILARAISKHKLTDVEVARVIVMANDWAAKSRSTVVNHGWVASGIGTVLRER